MIALLRTVSARDYRASPGRLALMLGGIASGVALIAALGIINESVVANFRTMLERAAGKAALQVTLGTGEVGFDESLVQTIGADPGVAQAFGFTRGALVAADQSGRTARAIRDRSRRTGGASDEWPPGRATGFDVVSDAAGTGQPVRMRISAAYRGARVWGPPLTC